MALYLIGLGLWDEKDISLKGLELAKSCDELFLEEYTSKLFGTSVEKLEALIGKKIKVLSRADVEQKDIIIKSAKKYSTALLVGGDPTVATTHTDIITQAYEAKIPVKIIHSSSIYSAISECGLFIYKFGRSCSIPFPQKNFNPTSFYDILAANQKECSHTLVFLDIKAEENRYMSVNEALQSLLNIEKEKKLGVITRDTPVVGIARLGSEDQTIKSGKISELLNFDFGKPQHILIIPGKMHFMEEKLLNVYP
jgi:diphthine synthase